MDNFLSLRGLCKAYDDSKKGKLIALDEFSINIAEGCFAALLGPSGSGKSTLLEILAGLTPPDEGRIFFQNRDITCLAPEQRKFSLVFQSYALFPNLTVLDNIAYGLGGPGWNKTSRMNRALELVAVTSLEGLEHRYPHELSGGQQQRTALARALAPHPRLLLLDEPLSALDAQVRRELGLKLRHIQRETGVTTLLVTHDQEEALALSDLVILMEQGKIIQAGSPEEIYSRPNSRFSADFVGHMNTIELPAVNSGRLFGLRYEDVEILIPTEQTLARPEVQVGRVEHCALMGAFYRLEILLNDFSTSIQADVARSADKELLKVGAIVVAAFPSEHRLQLNEL
ncbi:putative 2-aminoethylphosphonate ABC transporter ATP-binding protein [Deltaproteobacteria bacterium Smac51]|nr:putative 2-aminoethylphosphonate ABC transporter ATP-binding protein [Deltaproteobacteria bacterium Smac51]